MRKVTLLIVEDEVAIRDMLRFSLSSAEFLVIDAENAFQAVEVLADRIPDLIILDWMLPGKSGIEFIKWIKKKELLKNLPIIMLTAKAEEDNKIKGLTAGADDYIVKPFSIQELIARIRAVLRRGLLISPSNEIRVGALVLNTATHQVVVNEQFLKLTPIEYKMLYFFLTHPNQTYSRDQLMTYIWGGRVYIDDRTIDVQVRRLRSKLRPYGYCELIKTVRGMGYISTRECDA